MANSDDSSITVAGLEAFLFRVPIEVPRHLPFGTQTGRPDLNAGKEWRVDMFPEIMG